jgi:hypothetical protein
MTSPPSRKGICRVYRHFDYPGAGIGHFIPEVREDECDGHQAISPEANFEFRVPM